MIEQVTFSVSGMRCDGCAKALGSALRFVNGVVSAQADQQSGLVKLTYDSAEIGVDDLRSEIESFNYEVVP